MAKKICKQCGKKYTPKFDNQEDCSPICLANRFDKLARKTRKIAKIYAWTQHFRSMAEVRYAARLESHGIHYEYEGTTVNYQYDPQKYTVDFSVVAKNKKGNPVYLEFKGKLDATNRKKLRAIKKSNPEMDLRLVFEKPTNKLYRGAKLRYWEWAERHGFLWYDANDIDKLKKDLLWAKLNVRKKATSTG